MGKINVRMLLILVLTSGIWSCREKPVPKPHGYYRIAFRNKSYHELQTGFPYSFEIPGYSSVVPDPSPYAEPFWINVEIPEHKAEIHLSYKKVQDNLFIFTEESRELAYDHTQKASSIEEEVYLNPSRRVFGTLYHINGNAASPMQFYLTDSIRHFLRGAVYIRATPNIDSLKPVIGFLKADVIRLIETLRWVE